MPHACAKATRRVRDGRAESVWIGAFATLLLAGCAATSMEREAPAVTALSIDAAKTRGYAESEVRRGRELFLAKCGDCHRLQPPADRTEREWRSILPRMARRARLDAEEARSVEAYVFSVPGR